MKIMEKYNHGSRHCPTATMVPSPQHHRIQQLANMLCDKSMPLKLENIIDFTMYLLAILAASVAAEIAIKSNSSKLCLNILNLDLEFGI